MASTPKKPRYAEEPSKMGYIQNVTPLKTSMKTGKKYFNAVLQTQSKFEDLVAYKPEAHQTFVEMAKAKTPVCLKKTETIPSLTKVGQFDVKYTSYSTIESPKETITFQYTQFQEQEVKLMVIQDIKSKSQIRDKVSLIGTVVSKHQAKTIATKNLTLSELDVADQTDHIQVTVWNDQIGKVTEGKTYKFINIIVRWFNDEMQLSASTTTSIEEVPQLTDITEVPKKVTTYHPIDAIASIQSTQCAFCGVEMAQFNKAIPTVKCGQCQKKMTLDKVKCVTTTTITINGIDYKINENILKESVHNYAHLSTDELEDELLLHYKAGLCSGRVTGIEKINI